MSRNAQMIRFLKMIRHLENSADGLTIREMAVYFTVNPKTIRRDLAAMKKAGVNLSDMIRNDSKYYRIIADRDATIDPVRKFAASVYP